MRFRTPGYQVASLAGLGVAIQLCCVDPARGEVISASPMLPILGAAYISIGSAGCFPTAGVCVTAGSLTLAPPVSVTFNPMGEDILSDASFLGQITTLGGAPLGVVSLLGTVEQEVLGRTSSMELGSWTTDLTGLALSGPALGHTLTLGLDGSSSSSGVTSIVRAGDDFRISSFFDVFVDLTLDTSPPLHADRGPILFEAVPEPISLLVLGPAGLALLAARRRGRANSRGQPRRWVQQRVGSETVFSTKKNNGLRSRKVSLRTGAGNAAIQSEV
jgi:hypothetical protein